ISNLAEAGAQFPDAVVEFPCQLGEVLLLTVFADQAEIAPIDGDGHLRHACGSRSALLNGHWPPARIECPRWLHQAAGRPPDWWFRASASAPPPRRDRRQVASDRCRAHATARRASPGRDRPPRNAPPPLRAPQARASGAWWRLRLRWR